MQLTLTLEAEHGATTEVLLDADPATPLRIVEQVLAPHLPAPGRLLLAGAPLDADLALGDSGLRDGVRLGVGTPLPCPPAARPGTPQLHVVGGPDAGCILPLSDGRTVLGRGAVADLRLDDKGLSRRHLAVSGGNPCSVEDLGSTNGTWLDGEALEAGVPAPLTSESLLVAGRSRLALRYAAAPDAVLEPDGIGGLAYNRPPRVAPVAPAVRVQLPVPPAEREAARVPWLAALLPLALGGVLAAVTHSPTFLLFSLLSPLLLLGNVVQDRRTGRRRSRQEARRYADATAEAGAQLRAARLTEEQVRRRAGPDPAALLVAATGPTGRLWERRAGDADALALRVGLADQRAEVELVAPPGTPPPEPPVAREVPVLLPLRALGVVGVAGPVDSVRATARWLVAQAAVLHSPRDLRVVVLADGGADGGAWSWVRWLPHARDGDRADRSIVRVGTDAETTGCRVAELTALVERRTARLEARGGRPRPGAADPEPAVLVVLDGARGLRRLSGVPRLLGAGPSVGVHVLCLDEDESSLPEECSALVLHGRVPASGLTVRSAGGEPLDHVLPDAVSTSWAMEVARALAPLRDTSDDGRRGLPTDVRLLDLLGLDQPSAGALLERWSDRPASTAATVGQCADGPFVLDLAAGPHVLVAGTTGSGKSELLQTLVASLAVGNRPARMSFVLVDYKGGAAFRDCARLPHTVGLVTDLDPHLTRRALASLSAELRRRESLLAVAGVPDLPAYERLGGPCGPLPRLVIVVDEFAALSAELPEFVRGLVGAAQRGRSLGVHLVLATQRPGGVVSPEIRANTDLRIALRVTDEADSRDVLDSPAAAHLPRHAPGRALVRTGPAPPSAFQTARVGGSRSGTGAGAPYAVAVPWEQAGRPPAACPRVEAGDGDTDLQLLVEALREASAHSGALSVQPPWLPPLPPVLSVDDLAAGACDELPYGLADLPAEQDRRPAVLDLAAGGHLLVVGTARTGRTTLLRTVAGQLARTRPVEDVHLHVLDCAGGGLLGLMALPHVGAVVCREETERVVRLLTRLLAEVARRQDLLARAGWADLPEQRAAAPSGAALPYLVLLLDGWEAFLHGFEDVDGGRPVDVLLRLLREGPAAGLRVVMTSGRGGLLGRVSALLDQRLVLRLADPADAALAGLSPRDLPEQAPPGRGVLTGGTLAGPVPAGDAAPPVAAPPVAAVPVAAVPVAAVPAAAVPAAAVPAADVEVQVALLAPDASGPAQVAALKEIGQAAQADVPACRRPFRVDPLPVVVTLEQLADVPGDRLPDASSYVPLGLGGEQVLPVGVDLAEDGPGFLVAGPRRSGRSTALVTMATALVTRRCGVVAVLPRRSPLADVDGLLAVLRPDENVVLAGLLAREGPVVVLVDDVEALHEAPVTAVLQDVLRHGPGRGRAVVVAGSAEELAATFRGLVVEVRRSRCGLLLQPQGPLDGDLLGLRLPRASGTGPPGRGLLAVAGQVTPVQVALA